jgi:sugar lactone lactonase YvrE
LLAASPAAAQDTTFPNHIPFDAAKGEIAEGVAVDQVGNVFVSFGSGSATRGEIVKFTPSGARSVLAELPSGVAGLAVDASANVYAATGSGVFRVDRQGRAVLLPGTEQIVAANALAFDHRGNLYVTESFSFDPPFTAYPGCNPDLPAFGRGGIWRIPPGGTAALWLRDDLLSGMCHIPGVPFPIGANGIACYQDGLYVVNTERGLVVRVPVLPNGDPGPVGIVAHVPEPYPTDPPVPPGADGIALDLQGNFYLAMPSHNVVVRMSPDGKSWETIGTAADFIDAPGSLAFGTGKGERTSLFITSMAMFPGGAGPGLVKIDAGIPGLPLP